LGRFGETSPLGRADRLNRNKRVKYGIPVLARGIPLAISLPHLWNFWGQP